MLQDALFDVAWYCPGEGILEVNYGSTYEDRGRIDGGFGCSSQGNLLLL
jgi:hypothetical protein